MRFFVQPYNEEGYLEQEHDLQTTIILYIHWPTSGIR